MYCGYSAENSRTVLLITCAVISVWTGLGSLIIRSVMRSDDSGLSVRADRRSGTAIPSATANPHINLSGLKHKYCDVWCERRAGRARRPRGGHSQRLCPRAENAARSDARSHPFGTARVSPWTAFHGTGHTFGYAHAPCALSIGESHCCQTSQYLCFRPLSLPIAFNMFTTTSILPTQKKPFGIKETASQPKTGAHQDRRHDPTFHTFENAIFELLADYSRHSACSR